MNIYTLLLINVLIFYVVFEMLRMIFFLLRNKLNARKLSKPFSYEGEPENTILILGDSTAVGVGASKPEDTLAGLFQKDFPNSTITNVAKNGGLVTDVVQQLKSLDGTPRKLIVMSVGGNDVWRLFVPVWSLRKHVNEMFQRALEINPSGRIVLLFYVDIGNAPFFPFFIRWILRSRSHALYDLFREITDQYGILMVDLSAPDLTALTYGQKIYSSDHLHPSSAGYYIWYKKLWHQMIKRGMVYHEERKLPSDLSKEVYKE